MAGFYADKLLCWLQNDGTSDDLIRADLKDWEDVVLGALDDRERIIHTKPVSVLWLDFDNGGDEMHGRVEAIGRALDLAPGVPFHYVTMPDPWLDASDYDSDSFVELRVAAYNTKATLIVVLWSGFGGIDFLSEFGYNDARPSLRAILLPSTFYAQI